MAFKIDSKAADDLVNRIEGGLRDRKPLHVAIGVTVRNLVQGHFARLNSERANKLGGKRTNFYANAARSTQSQADNEKATVSVNALGIRQRLEGGPIAPVSAKYLTIPAVSEAYGRRAREFSNLVLVYGRNRQPVALAEAQATTLGRNKKSGKFESRGETGGRVMYWLVKSVTQQADRSVLPADEVFQSTIHDATGKFFERMKRRAA